MPRLFTGLEIPPEIGAELALYRGGLPGARWADPANYHITLRFIGDVDHGIARDIASMLAEERPRAPIRITLDALSTFGGSRPRALLARVAPTPELTKLQADQERLMRRVGLEPESRKYTPHVTLARLRDASAGEVAGFIAMRGHFPKLSFTAERFVLFSARDTVGGGPYLVEAAYPMVGGGIRVGRPFGEARPEQRLG
ncbi:RNA 2',3'-cyclic phosphodiesterase [Enterovirga aerilata]|uniref:RNA 2',3'-cyclic phosphodiesterase n=1 Tax=Enterovirga aerilata TaxID=2730920 RepID=A0A849I3S4_9HYPH|nr:RNA 2',3'-cyclic phosphodiesterase [Enterovirga sp. DB1703]NNM71039.1 RNA 2',3'-cyclic phosphodiesterase [Enterovirga sp. DB1703]